MALAPARASATAEIRVLDLCGARLLAEGTVTEKVFEPLLLHQKPRATTRDRWDCQARAGDHACNLPQYARGGVRSRCAITRRRAGGGRAVRVP